MQDSTYLHCAQRGLLSYGTLDVKSAYLHSKDTHYGPGDTAQQVVSLHASWHFF